MKKKKVVARKKSVHSKKVANKSIIKEFLAALGIAVVLVIATSNIPTTTVLGSNSNQSVLGDDDQEKQAEEQKKEEEKHEEEQKKEEEKHEEEQKKEEEKHEEEQKKEAERNTSGKSSAQSFINTTRVKTQSEGNKKETEIETAAGQKIKTKVEDDGTTKVEVEDGGRKVKYVVENGRVILKIRDESGEDRDATEEELEDIHDELEQEFEDKGIDVATEGGKIRFAKNNVSAHTAFPLSVNVDTKQLIVSTPNGDKVVTILPDQAVSNLINTGIINKITGTTNTDVLGSDITLEDRDGEAVYRVEGKRVKRLFGLIPVETNVTAFVSAEDGIPVATEQSLFSNIINTISL